jgi:hypothetical protein
VLLYTFAALTKEVQLYCRSNAGIADLRHTFEGESYPFITLFIGFKRDVAFGLQKPIIVWEIYAARAFSQTMMSLCN